MERKTLMILTVFLAIPVCGCMSIQEAALEGDIEHIKTLLAFGANINGGTFFGDQGTPLHRASGAGQVETVKFLIENGADVNISNEASQVPLCYAAWNGHAEVAKVLLDNGAYVKGRHDKVPLITAAENGHLEVVKILLSYGADIDQQAGMGYTALNSAVGAKPEHVEVVKFLLSKGADVNIKAAYDRTPLFTAVGQGNIELVNLLFDAGAEVNIICNGRTVLIASGINDDIMMTEWLLARGADVNAQGAYHNTPLNIAHCRNNIEMGRILLEYGADPKLTHNEKQIPESYIEKLRK